MTDKSEPNSETLPDDWELEQRVFHNAGRHVLPDGTREELNQNPDPKELQQLIRDLWHAYCDMEVRALEAEGKP